MVNMWVWNQHESLSRTSLVIQWLGLCASRAGGVGSVPGQITRIPYAAWHSQEKRKEKEKKTISDHQITHTACHLLLNKWHQPQTLFEAVCMYVSVAQLGLTLCDTMDCIRPDSSLCGIFQAKIPEWVLPFSSLKRSF